MKYTLEYQTERGSVVYLDLIEVPAMNYQINNLNELKDRQAMYSQAIRLPKTKGNCLALGVPDVFEVNNNTAYIPGLCWLRCDDALLSGPSGMLYVNSVDQYINVQTVSGVADFFTQMANYPMDDAAFNLVWNRAGLQGYLTPGGARYKYFFTTVDKKPDLSAEWLTAPWGYNVNPFSIQRQLYSSYLFPSIPLRYTIEHIINRLGYTGDWGSSETTEMYNDYLSCSKLSNSQGMLYEGSAKVTSKSYSSVAKVYVPWDHLAESPSGAGLVKYVDYAGMIGVEYTANGDQLIEVSASCAFTRQNISSAKVLLQGVKYSGFNSTVDTEVNEMFGPGERSKYIGFPPKQIELKQGDRYAIYLFADITASSRDSITFSNGNLSFVLPSQEYNAPQIGDTINLLSATGFATAKDLFLFYIQLYGLTVDVDATNKVVRMRTIRNWYTQIANGNYADWSGKLAIDNSNSIEFRIGSYGQINNIKTKDNTSDNYTDTGTFVIADATLPDSKDLFTLGIEAGFNATGVIFDDILGPPKTVANIPIYEVTTENEITTRKYTQPSAPHLIADTGVAYTFAVIENGNAQAISLPLAIHKQMQSYVDQYYKELKDNILVQARRIEVMLTLDVVDIEQLDLFVPVYIEYFGAYFYISKISNFIEGRPTKVELIRL